MRKFVEKFSKNKTTDFKLECETRFQDFLINNLHFGIFSTPFSIDINILPPNILSERIELQAGTDFKEKFNNVSLFYTNYLPMNKNSWLNNIQDFPFWQDMVYSWYIYKNQD